MESDAIEEAAQLLNVLECVMPERKGELDPLRSELAPKAHKIALDLLAVARQLPEDEYFDAEPLVRRALDLERANEEARKLLEVIGASRAKWAPTYVKDIYAQPEGEGFILYFTIANSKGVMVRAPGKARLRVVMEALGREPAHDFGGPDATIKASDFEVREVGRQREKKLMYVFSRVAFKDVHLDSDGNRAAVQFRVGQGYHLKAQLTFELSSGGILHGFADVQPPE
jgi:hypothetical protein